MKVLILVLFGLFISNFGFCEITKSDLLIKQEKEKKAKKRTNRYYYGYLERSHTRKEIINDIAVAYGISWGLYPLTQPKTVKEDATWEKYKNNFGKLVFDQDAPFWNWFVHPIAGSQLYLYYRANSYKRSHALALASISAALFEFTVEIWTEPASIQDLYQTPILGSILGLGIENLSMYLLNSGNPIGKIIGHIINPSTLLWFYEGQVRLTPEFDGNGSSKLTLSWTF